MPVPSGRNPIRRNRNIGTGKQGHGQNNELVIPESWWDSRCFWEKLTEHRVLTRPVNGRDFTVIVEHTRKDCIHPCTVDDVFHLLSHVPREDLSGLDLLVMRQPKRKEQILSPVWGRLQFEAEFGERAGPAILLEAVDVCKPIRWTRSLDRQAAAMLDRLRRAGHRIESTRREHVIESTLESARQTMLYGTLLHEVGHWVDWCQRVLDPLACDEDPGAARHELERQYLARAVDEREDFAWRYADGLGAKLRRAGILPFDRLFDLETLIADGLRPEDFSGPASSISPDTGRGKRPISSS